MHFGIFITESALHIDVAMSFSQTGERLLDYCVVTQHWTVVWNWFVQFQSFLVCLEQENGDMILFPKGRAGEGGGVRRAVVQCVLTSSRYVPVIFLTEPKISAYIWTSARALHCRR